MGLKRFLLPLGALVVVAAVVLGLVSGALGSLARNGMQAVGLQTSQGAPTVSPGVVGPSGTGSAASGASATPGPSTAAPTADPSAALPSPVLAAASDEPVPSAGAVAARVRGVVVKDSGDYSGSVIDVGTGRTLYAHNATKGFLPASTMKLLTTTAALATLGAERRFATTVVSPGKGQLVLVGGGDPYLEIKPTPKFPAAATLRSLARSTAAALKKTGQTKVALGYDTSLFSGPSRSATWPASYADVVSTVSALWVNEGRVVNDGGVTGPRQADPAKVAASAFATELHRQGITVGTVRAARAPGSAAKVASVSSMTLERMVEHILMTSDNDGAEVLLRQAAIGAGRPGSLADGLATVRAQLTKLGAWDSGTVIYDGSGLSRSTRVPADVMAKVLRAASMDKNPALRPVITGLPVGGVEGSLAGKFGDDDTSAGRGIVRGKTGTLHAVHALAGVIRTRDGSLVAYAFLVNNPKNEYNATVWLERVTTAISTCGCR